MSSTIEAMPDRHFNEKRLSTLRAQLARRGHVVQDQPAGGFLVVWRSMLVRECQDLDALEAHARRVGALS